MPNSYAWIVDETWLELMKARGGVSSCYSVPLEIGGAVCKELSGRVLYIVARGKHTDYLFARIFVESVAIGSDDDDKETEYLLNTDFSQSLRISRIHSQQDARDYSIPCLKEIPLGFVSLNENELEALEAVVKAGFKVLFSSPPQDMLAKIDPPVQHCGAKYAAILVFKEVVALFSLSEMWGGRKYRHPGVNFVFYYLQKHPSFVEPNKIVESLHALDVYLGRLPATKERIQIDVSGRKQSNTAHLIDLSLIQIIPKNIKTRHFLPSVKAISAESVMQKTDAAEKRHQEMLRDISEYFIKHNIVPYQSQSIDLAIKHHNKTYIFELKSISDTNILQQISKGLFQLLYYSYMLQECGVSIGPIYLIVEKVGSEVVFEMMSKIAKKGGVVLLLYDVLQEWPQRLSFAEQDCNGIYPPFSL